MRPEHLRPAHRLVLQFCRLVLHHDDRRRLRLHVDGGRELRELRAAAPTGNRRVLRCSGRLLRDDADWLRQHRRRVSRCGDFLHARPVRHTAADGFLLRRRWLLLRDDSGRLLRYVVERRRLYAEHLRPANRLVLRG